MKRLFSLFKHHYPKFIFGFFVLLLSFSYLRIFAIGSPYQPGSTLDPACTPGEVNCIVSYDLTYFKQDGNSFSGTATLGTNDANALVLETNGTTRMTISSTGDISATGGNSALYFVASGGNGSGVQGGAAFKAGRDALLTANARGFQEFSTIDASNSSVGFAAFDANTQLWNTLGHSYDHAVGFESRIVFDPTLASGHINTMYGFWSAHSPKHGTVDNAYDFYASNFASTGGPGTITNHYGLYVENFAGSSYKATNNYGVYVAGTTQSYFGGNVGIGTTSPSAPLHVQGTGFTNSLITTTGNSTVQLQLQRNQTSGSFNNTWTFYIPASSKDLRFYDNILGDVMTLQNTTGRVGIGTTNPAGVLEVQGNAVAQIKTAGNNTTANSASLWLTSTFTGGGSIYAQQIDPKISTTATNTLAGLAVSSGSNGGATLTSSAGIMIGQQSAGTSNTDLLVGSIGVPGGNWGIYYAGSRNVYLGSGSVGIGTTNPLQIIHASKDGGSGGVQIEVQDTNATNAGVSYFGTYQGNTFLQSGTASKDIVFWDSGAERMRLKSGGDLLIGTSTDAGQKLQVSGTSLFTGASTFNSSITATSNGHRFGNLEITTSSNAVNTGQGIRVTGADSTFQLQGSPSGGVAAMFTFAPYNGNSATSALTTVDKAEVRLYGGFEDGNVGNISGNVLWISPTYDFTSNPRTGLKVRGIYYDPTLTDLTATTHIAIETVSGNNYFGSTSGSTMIGYASGGGTPTSYKLDVSGNINVSGTNRYYANGNQVLYHNGSNVLLDPAGYGVITGHFIQAGNYITSSTYVGSPSYIARGTNVTAVGDTGSYYGFGRPDNAVVNANVALAGTYSIIDVAWPGGLGLSWKTSSGADVSGGAFLSEKMRLTSGGNLLIGTSTDAGYKLQVGSASVSGIVARFTNSTGTCDINPTTTSLACSSDRTLKKNIVSFDSSILDKVLSLNPVTYNWNSESDGTSTHGGFIAQEVESLFPDLVFTDASTGLKSLNYMGLIPYTIKALQQLNLKVSLLPDITDATLATKIRDFLSGISNGVADIGKVKTQELCVDDICVTRDQFKTMVENATNQSQGSGSVTPPAEDPTIEESTPETPSDEETQDPENNQTDTGNSTEAPSL